MCLAGYERGESFVYLPFSIRFCSCVCVCVCNLCVCCSENIETYDHFTSERSEKESVQERITRKVYACEREKERQSNLCVNQEYDDNEQNERTNDWIDIMPRIDWEMHSKLNFTLYFCLIARLTHTHTYTHSLDNKLAACVLKVSEAHFHKYSCRCNL